MILDHNYLRELRTRKKLITFPESIFPPPTECAGGGGDGEKRRGREEKRRRGDLILPLSNVPKSILLVTYHGRCSIKIDF